MSVMFMSLYNVEDVFGHTISKNEFGRIMKYGSVVCKSCLLGGNLLYLSQRKW